MQIDFHQTHNPFYTTKKMLWKHSQKCASLAAITKYIAIIYTIGCLPIFQAR